MELRLDNRMAFVTGAGSGIGQGIAESFADAGANVTITYNANEAGAQETVSRVEAKGRRAIAVQGDVGDPDDVKRMFQQHDDVFGRLDILVNNAGIGLGDHIVDMKFDDWERVIRTNLHGPFLCMQQAARRMIDQQDGGRIINISSVHEEACTVGGSSYNASKAGLRNLMRTGAIELGPHGITVNGIAPGMIITPMNRRALDDPDYLHDAEQQIVAGRAGLPKDIAGMAIFLASDAASYCTGSTFFVDGGWMLTWPPV